MKCTVAGYPRPMALRYLGKPICAVCWRRYAEDRDRLRERLGIRERGSDEQIG